MDILIFNPDTDYALASDSETYNQPKVVARLAEEMKEFPRRYASPGDLTVAYSDATSLSAILDSYGVGFGEIERIRPWGWNRAIRYRLRKGGVPERLLPTDEELDSLRRLSHRRTTIEANGILNARFCEAGVAARHQSVVPREFSNVVDAMAWMNERGGDVFFKAPWSSSGRGVLSTKGMSRHKIQEWVGGIIRRQGSVMAEEAASKRQDFATEWEIESGKVRFKGLSYFEATQKGKYRGNFEGNQEEVLSKIREGAPDFDERIIRAQGEMLEALIAPGYQGPLGIDMLSDIDGRIRGCVEINLRMTMGAAYIKS